MTQLWSAFFEQDTAKFFILFGQIKTIIIIFIYAFEDSLPQIRNNTERNQFLNFNYTRIEIQLKNTNFSSCSKKTSGTISQACE